jgi:plastocyanin
MRARTIRRWSAATLVLGGLFNACGGGSSPAAPSTGSGSGSTSGTGSGTSNVGTLFTITSAGVSPKELTVSPGTRVQFLNNDSVPHDMESDPHPAHTDCPELAQVGFLAPGQTKETGNLNTPRTCGFHDHNQPSVTALEGRINIQ